MKKSNKTLIIIGILIIILILTLIAYYMLRPKTIKANEGYFSLTIPSKYNFINNPSNESDDETFEPDDLGIYDKKKNIFIYGNAYNFTNKDMLASVKEDKNSFIESFNGKDATEVIEFKINSYSAYKYGFYYTDSNKDEFYMVVTWIKTNQAIYNIDIECLKNDKEASEKDILKIISSFKEL